MKVVVWDLDDTLWDGTLLEDRAVTLRSGILEIIRTLDGRGILQSVASKNDHAAALAKLQEFGITEYLLYPQINWNSKAASVKTIASSLDVSLDAVAFIDDQIGEREEVAFWLPQVICLDSADVGELLERPEFKPRFVTEDSKARRLMYLSAIERRKAETEFAGRPEAFLATLGMELTIDRATPGDLERAEELTLRTNQFNTSGYTYSYEELDRFRQSPDHLLLIASLTDKYGSYGKIGLALVSRAGREWNIKLLLMSCRVISRGVGTILINCIMTLARDAGARLRAEFVANERNRMMFVSYKFANFREAERHGNLLVLENDLSRIQDIPPYVKVTGTYKGD